MAKNIAKTTGKGGNFRKTSAGAGMTEKVWLHIVELILVPN